MKFLEEYLKQENIKLISEYFKRRDALKNTTNIKQVEFLKQYAQELTQQLTDNNKFLYERRVK